MGMGFSGLPVKVQEEPQFSSNELRAMAAQTYPAVGPLYTGKSWEELIAEAEAREAEAREAGER